MPKAAAASAVVFPKRLLFAGTYTLVWLIITNPNSLYVVLCWLIGFLGYQNTSAASTGAPNAVELWLRSSGLVSPSFSVSLKFKVRLLPLRQVLFVHLHHWLYLLILFAIFRFLMRPWAGGGEKEGGWKAMARDAVEAMCLGGFTQGLVYEDWRNVLWIASGGKE